MATMEVTDLLRDYSNGDETSWEAEFAWLYRHHAPELETLRRDVSANGIVEPVLLGDDARVWDGHHRLCLAVELGITSVPVTVMS